MNSKSCVSLQFQRPDARAEFEKARRDPKNAEGSFEDQVDTFFELALALDTGVARAKRDLIATSLMWNEENQAAMLWIHQQHHALLEMGTRLVQSRSGDTRNVLMPRLIMQCIFHWAESVKWGAWRERDQYKALHDLYLLAASGKCLDTPATITADGRGQSATVERLYLRALLLDRFASGSLTRQQVEIVDAWLWAWHGALKAERTYPGAASLRADLDTNTGLREGPCEGDSPTIYVRLEPLETERRKIIAELHRGRMVPPHGCTADMRIEEHVAVLDYLQRALRLAGGDAPQRAPREQQAGIRLEVWIGLSEILARGVGVGTETGRYRALQMNDPSIEQASRMRFADAARRYLWMSDSSSTGFGFEALETDAAGIEVGDLIGWRKGLGGAIVIGQVMRRMPSSTSGQVFVGVKLLTEHAVPMPLHQVVAFDNGFADGTYLFVPGDDDSGRRDGFVISEKTFELQATYSAHVGKDHYSIRFNRVRSRGRGWLLAGFEILPVKGPETEMVQDLTLPNFDFTLDPIEMQEKGAEEEEISLSWDRELSPRLLA